MRPELPRPTLGEAQPRDRVGQAKRGAATRLALPRRQQGQSRPNRRELRDIGLDFAPVARALPEERLGELSAANPEESGHLGIELAGCIDDPQRRRGERRGCSLKNHGSSIEVPGERRPTAG